MSLHNSACESAMKIKENALGVVRAVGAEIEILVKNLLPQVGTGAIYGETFVVQSRS